MLENCQRQMFIQPLMVTKSSFLLGNFKRSSRGSEKEICKPPQSWQYCKYGSWLTTGERKIILWFGASQRYDNHYL